MVHWCILHEEEQITKVEVKGQNSKDDSYSAGSARTATRMEMSIRDTPQSVHSPRGAAGANSGAIRPVSVTCIPTIIGTPACSAVSA